MKPLPVARRAIVVARTGWRGLLPGRKRSYRLLTGEDHVVLTGVAAERVSVVRTGGLALPARTVRIWRRRKQRRCGGPERGRKVGFLCVAMKLKAEPPPQGSSGNFLRKLCQKETRSGIRGDRRSGFLLQLK